MTVRYLAIDDYIAIAVAVTGQQVVTLVNATDTALADSALHGPSASFAGEDFYPDFVDKAAVLVVHPSRPWLALHRRMGHSDGLGTIPR